MTTVARILVLVGLWLLAWGDLSVANVCSGAAVAVLLLAAFPPVRRGRGSVRLSVSGLLRLGAYVVAQLWNSNIEMSRRILSRTPGTAGVVAHRLRTPSDEVVTVMSSVIALSPGTMTVDVAPDSSRIYVHFFDLEDLGQARRGIARLEELTVAAIQRGRPGRTVVPAPEEVT